MLAVDLVPGPWLLEKVALQGSLCALSLDLTHLDLLGDLERVTGCFRATHTCSLVEQG